MSEVESAKLSSKRSNKINKRVVKALVFPLKKQEGARRESKELPEDPWEAMSLEGQVLEPPFDLLTLSMLPEHNSELEPCIEAMQANIDGFGHRIIPRLSLSSLDEVEREKVKKENVDLQNFFAYANLKGSFVELRKRLRKDLEATGNGWLEIIRGLSGEIQSLNQIPSYQMRLGVLDVEPILTDLPVLELQVDGSVEVKTIKAWRRFRPYVQSRMVYQRGMAISASYQIRWFKEFGDPRIMDNTTGEYLEGQAASELPESKKASEIVHFKIYSARSPYGLPRFIGNLLSIFGDRAAEEINYATFKNNNIPSMALLVSNGQLTGATIKRIESFVESQIQGSDNYSKFLIVEAESDSMDGEDAGQVKIDIKPLTKEQHTDELFQEYSKNNQDKVRRAFRLPPILVGKSEDYTRSTAESSRRLADEQIFAPERDEFDNWVNLFLFPSMGVKYHRFKSNSPNTTDNTELIRILSGAEKTGGMTPRIARGMLSDILGIELPEFSDDFPADVPFSMTMAEAVKNKADPTEVGQQITALKRYFFESKGLEFDGASFIDYLLKVRQTVEKRWREEVTAA